jgi:cell division septation protein DedD
VDRGQASGRAGDAALNEPAGTGFVVQVAAVRQRGEANTIARRLSGKGYRAFVTTAGANFRVRVGKFNDRREAELVAGRLEREEQFKPWITR